MTPPALVETLPPIVQVPSDASDSGNSRSAASAAACASASVTPASQIMTSACGSTSRIARKRWVETMISSPLSSGVWPPTSPVLPPCGVMPIRASLQKAAIAATSLRRGRPNERERLAAIESARLDERAGEEGWVRQHVARPHDAFQGGKNDVALRCVQPRSLRARGFALGRRKTAAISTWGEKRNWSSGVTASIR